MTIVSALTIANTPNSAGVSNRDNTAVEIKNSKTVP